MKNNAPNMLRLSISNAMLNKKNVTTKHTNINTHFRISSPRVGLITPYPSETIKSTNNEAEMRNADTKDIKARNAVARKLLRI
jgi:hypothetical protein